MRMKERLYLTEDRSKAVYSSDRRGRHLLCKQGSELDDKLAKKYGLFDGRLSAIQPLGTEVKKPERPVKDAIKKMPNIEAARKAGDKKIEKEKKGMQIKRLADENN